MSQHIVASALGLAVVTACSLWPVASLASQLRKREPKSAWYEDADGKSTPESMAAFSATAPKATILGLATVGCGISITISLLESLHAGNDGSAVENWISTASWCLIVLQAIVLLANHKPVRSYELAIYTLFSALGITIVRLSAGISMASSLWHSDRRLLALRLNEIVSAICVGFASTALPRRPDVFDPQGRRVDRQFTVSAFSRFSFHWCLKLLNVADSKKNLDLEDLDRPDHQTRSAALTESYRNMRYTGRLWSSLIRAHLRPFILQWTLCALTSFLRFAPQLCILNLLRGLEKMATEGSENIGLDIWIWVVWLGLSIATQSWVDNYLFWLCYADLMVTIRAQLSALIFEKAMRRKDVKGVEKKEKKEDDPSEATSTSNSDSGIPEANKDIKTDGDDDEDDDDEGGLAKTRQSTINLIGVDTKKVSDFCAFNNFIPGSFLNLIISLFFLGNLLGWRALIAGFSVMFGVTPLNWHYSKVYAKAEDKLMKVRDQKMAVVTEALQGIRQIKFSALEDRWEKKILGVREKELKSIWDVLIADVWLIGMWLCNPILLASVALSVYAWLEGTLTPSVAFVSLGVFRALEITLAVVPELLTNALDAWVSVKRIEEYLDGPELENITEEDSQVSFIDATIAWPSDNATPEDERFTLRNLSFAFPEGELSIISGRTGTGKSLMLAAILGEIDLVSGTITAPRAPPLEDRHDLKATPGDWIIPGAMAYVAQIPWIENASIRNNILFGLPYDTYRYEATIDACALRKDLAMMTDGERTEIGANGINLSGGQKWRVTLARAIYSRAGVLVMDDIFSAVDAHVGRHIFEKCLCGPLGIGRTRIVVTHHVALCAPKTKFLVELGEGGALHAGLVADLAESGVLDKIKVHEQSKKEIKLDELEATAVIFDQESEDCAAVEDEEEGNTLQKVTSNVAEQPKKFVEEERRDVGAVKSHVYRTFFRESGGWLFWAFVLTWFVFVQALTLGRSWWLKIWTGSQGSEALNITNSNGYDDNHGISISGMSIQHPYTSTHALGTHPVLLSTSTTLTDPHGVMFYLWVYVALSLGAAAFGTARVYIAYRGSILASRKLFEKLNFAVLRTPLRWLDTVPLGRILNRFTADFTTMDSNLMNSLMFGLMDILVLLGVIVAGIFVSWSIIALAVVLLVICLKYALQYLNGARPAKRLESTSKSPVFETFGSALSGVATVRAFDRAGVFVERMHEKIDDYSCTTWYIWLFNRWMGLRMGLIGSAFAVMVAGLVLIVPGGMEPALAGFTLSFALEFTAAVMWAVRHYAAVELNMNATERIVEYTELGTESLEGVVPAAAWPQEGMIEVKDLVVGYADDLPAVLKGVSFEVGRNERVGVVGRTGAGKSSLTLALFRFLEAREGGIFIDGVDISGVKLGELRSRLAIIPQDPVLFSGTVRSNLDPFDQQPDSALLDSLHRVHLITESDAASPVLRPTSSSSSSSGSSTPKNPTLSLTTPISEGGLNLSQGQRQLVCLARAIVARPKIMVLDEATSAVDMATDALIQSSIREEFDDSTLLVIAHRLSTIADFDRILVLSDGGVAEYGSPRELWGDETAEEGEWGAFRGMCEESGERERLKGVVFGGGKK